MLILYLFVGFDFGYVSLHFKKDFQIYFIVHAPNILTMR